MTHTTQTELEKKWNANYYKKLTEDEERYIELMAEDELTHEEHQFCREFERKLNARI